MTSSAKSSPRDANLEKSFSATTSASSASADKQSQLTAEPEFEAESSQRFLETKDVFKLLGREPADTMELIFREPLVWGDEGIPLTLKLTLCLCLLLFNCPNDFVSWCTTWALILFDIERFAICQRIHLLLYTLNLVFVRNQFLRNLTF